MELQQSLIYAKYISSLGWQIITVDGVRMFYKKIPLMGGLLKIQRPKKLPGIPPVDVTTIAIEPDVHQNITDYKKWVSALQKKYRVVRSGYMPTKTIRIDIKPTEEKIFSAFSEAKRRAVRKAQKNGVIVAETRDIRGLIRIKNKSGGLLGFITTHGIDKFWDIMAPKYATIVLARKSEKVVGGVLLVFWNKTAFYWIAGATREGKKLFAPTLLVWEALKVARARGATKFDFVGVWDERMPNEHHDWKGFTRFKEGFGGTTLYYPILDTAK
jgi:lipid II:glycine glycyltransferase (peptidoglycan interpeptide bridge formation enzyme)